VVDLPEGSQGCRVSGGSEPPETFTPPDGGALAGARPARAARLAQVRTDRDRPGEVDDPAEATLKPSAGAGKLERRDRLADQLRLSGGHGDALSVHGVEGAQGVADDQQAVGPVAVRPVGEATVAGLPVHGELAFRFQPVEQLAERRFPQGAEVRGEIAG